jgi:serine/threonine protein phosphatase PrpC
VFSELKLNGGTLARPDADGAALLRQAAHGANACISAYVEANPGASGMGATLVAAVLHGASLRWVSVGDSLLYLYRGGTLTRLNEEHSYGRQMVLSGMIDAAAAQSHPDRNCLTSVLAGGDIAEIDCPAEPCSLQDRDILVFASDGLEHLDITQIEATLGRWRGATSAQIVAALMREVERADDPDQDNVCIVVVKVRAAPALARARQRGEAPQASRAPAPAKAQGGGTAQGGTGLPRRIRPVRPAAPDRKSERPRPERRRLTVVDGTENGGT